MQHETLTGTVKHINEGQIISFKENCSKNFNLEHRCWRQHRHRGYQIRSPQLRWGELKMNDNKQTDYQENLKKYILSMYLILHKGLIYNFIIKFIDIHTGTWLQIYWPSQCSSFESIYYFWIFAKSLHVSGSKKK